MIFSLQRTFSVAFSSKKKHFRFIIIVLPRRSDFRAGHSRPIHLYRRENIMEVERINQIQNLTDDLTRRLTELRGYL